MTMRYTGGGHKQMYRIVDFKRDKDEIPGIVQTIEYDPNRTARIALVTYKDGEKRYIIAPHGLKVGQTLLSGKGAAPEIGNTLFMSEIPFGTIIHNVELRPGGGGKMAAFADISIKAPGATTKEIQEAHLVLYHTICALIEAHYFPEIR